LRIKRHYTVATVPGVDEVVGNDAIRVLEWMRLWVKMTDSD
jgi:hypothetical protein